MKILKIVLFVVICISKISIYAQSNLTQTIKGIVHDKESQAPIPGATIVVEDVSPQLAVSSDTKGNFLLEKVPLGRHNLKISMMGFEPFYFRELLVSSGKEVYILAELKESSIQLNEVTVKANSNKDLPINSMGLISARQLSIEEANRYAGGFDDPARLASSFAGVAGSLQSNGIVIRGNAPKGLLWRMEGVEISNPTHFANLTSFGGGGLTALSSQMLSNSDFFTGAFPSEYGNALSGVFDLKLRNGNNDKTEFTIQAGLIGLDFSAEGPLKKGKKSSFLFNYRYSTYSLLGPVMPDDAQGIRYQDLSFKFNFPTDKAGTFSIWGIGALDKSPQKAETDSALWEYNQDKEEAKNNLGMGALGLNHRIMINNKSYLNTSLSASGNNLRHDLQRLNNQLVLQPMELVNYDNWKYSFSSFINYKFNYKHTNRTGITIDNLNYSYLIKDADIPGSQLSQLVDSKGNSNLIQVYSQSKYEIIPSLTIIAGVHSQYFSLNKKQTLEPRCGITWQFAPKHSFSFGFGNHSQLEMLQVYLLEKSTSSGNSFPNKKLGFSRANHFVFGYNWKINDNLHLKIEPYYQYLYNIPVIPGQSFSILNVDKDWFINDSLVNKGIGHNTGIDITFERFLNKGYYYMLTTSIFDSKYIGGENVERNTRYNKNFVLNILAGKEWTLKNKNLLSLNGKFCFMGGDHITPLNQEESLQKQKAVEESEHAFASTKPNLNYVDFTLNYKINHKKYNGTWSIKIINLLNAKEYYDYQYNLKNKTMDLYSEVTFVPNISYKIEF